MHKSQLAREKRVCISISSKLNSAESSGAQTQGHFYTYYVKKFGNILKEIVGEGEKTGQVVFGI